MKTFSIFGSLLLSIILIAGAYVLSSSGGGLHIADADSNDALLKAYAQKDTDADGLYDWQETIYGTDPENAHSIKAEITDGEAVAQGLIEPKFKSSTPVKTSTEVPGVDAAPETLTDRFAREFLGQYLSDRGAAQPTADQMSAFIQSAVKDLAATNSSNQYSAAQVIAGGSGSAAFALYKTNFQNVLVTNSPSKDKEDVLEHFSSFVTSGDTQSLVRIKTVGSAYTKTGVALMRIPVPTEVAETHLRLARAYATLGAITTDLALIDSDPLKAFVALNQYNDAMVAVARALLDVTNVITASVGNE